ncbi:formate--tetrahydrofolate ligase, partial [Methylobacterium hispanicum]
ERLGVEAITCKHWAEGGAGAEALAQAVVRLAEGGAQPITYTYETESKLTDKIKAIATKLYGAADIQIESKAAQKLAAFEAEGYGHLPVCMAKTQYSFSTDPTLIGAPDGHIVGVRDVRLSAGAGFVVVICGEIMTMPGLPKVPAADTIRLDANGQIDGLF